MDVVDPYAPPRAELGLPRPAAAPPLWNPDAAGVWSVFLTPIFGSTLVWRNWKAIGDARRAQVALYWLIASVLCYIVLALMERRVLALVYLLIWYFGAQRPQTLYLKKTWPEGYPRKSWLVPLLCGLGALLAMIALSVWAAMSAGSAPS